VLVLLYYKY